MISEFLDAIATPVVADDSSGKIIHLNAAFTQAFGYTKADVPNLETWWPLAYPDPDYLDWVKGEWFSRLTKSRETGEVFEPFELQLRTRNGKFRTGRVS